jgi:hypothetical protein
MAKGTLIEHLRRDQGVIELDELAVLRTNASLGSTKPIKSMPIMGETPPPRCSRCTHHRIPGLVVNWRGLGDVSNP